MKQIKLKPNGVGRYDSVSPFIVTDNRLELQVELPNFNGEFYFVHENNGKSLPVLLPRSGQIVLDNLTAGELKAAVKHYVKGELIKSYTVEPLLLKEADGTLSALPEIEALRRQIEAGEREFAEYKETTTACENALTGRIEALEKNFLALMRFALNDYQNNVYLNGGTIADFITEFGFELTEEQISLIKGEKENDKA